MTTIKTQRFGVEIEFTGITRSNAANVIATYFSTSVRGPLRDAYYTRTISDRKGRNWKIQRDSSIAPEIKTRIASNIDEYRVEMVTPILKYEDIEDLQEIVRNLRAAGAKANGSCGIHIHVDGANHTARSLKNLMEFMVARQYLINECLNNESRTCRWCKPISQTLLNAVRKEKDLTKDSLEAIWYSEANDHYYGRIDHSHYNETRYHGLNLHAFYSKGTVEWKQP